MCCCCSRACRVHLFSIPDSIILIASFRFSFIFTYTHTHILSHILRFGWMIHFRTLTHTHKTRITEMAENTRRPSKLAPPRPFHHLTPSHSARTQLSTINTKVDISDNESYLCSCEKSARARAPPLQFVRLKSMKCARCARAAFIEFVRMHELKSVSLVCVPYAFW